MLKIAFGDLAQRARRAFKLTGRLPLSLDETVIPVAIVAQLDADPYRQEPRTWSFAATLTGTAGLNGQAEISNPFGSNQLIVVKGFTLCTSATNVMQWGVTRGIVGILGAGIAQPVLLNSPNGFLGQPGQSATRFRSGQNAGNNVGTVGSITGLINTLCTVIFPDPIVLFPGDTAWWSSLAVVATFQMTYWGAEYVQTSP